MSIRQKVKGQSEALQTYLMKTKASQTLYERARRIFAGGQSHNARHFAPYPFFAKKAKGRFIWDVDGNRYTDYWMGHTALILGHSPAVVVSAIREQLGNGLFFGSPNELAFELGELITKAVPCAESIRFCTSGAEATMYAARLARAFTGRKVIAKIAGGWHGYNSTLTIGVSSPYGEPESAGLLDDDARYSRLLTFNDIDEIRNVLTSDVAAVIVEPVLGGGGVVPAEKEYLISLREECDRVGSLLIFDEIITGFRLALGGAQEWYGLKPDLCTLGKIIGGGLPASAIAGRSEIMSLADTTQRRRKTERCWIGGGTFSENALPMKAGAATLRYLQQNINLYKRLANMGHDLSTRVDRTFGECGIRTQTTGAGSLFATHFLSEGQERIRCAEDVNSSRRDLETAYYFDLIARHGIYFIPGHIGAISSAHTKNDVSEFVQATEIVANDLRNKENTS